MAATWNNGSCGPNQTFCSQILVATLRHHMPHLAQKMCHLFNFPVHQIAPKTILWRPQTNISNGQLPQGGGGTREGEYISSSSSLQECIRQLNVMTLINVSTCKCTTRGSVQPHHSWSQRANVLYPITQEKPPRSPKDENTNFNPTTRTNTRTDN